MSRHRDDVVLAARRATANEAKSANVVAASCDGVVRVEAAVQLDGCGGG